TKSAALDWSPHGIRFNCVAPGSTDTPMLRRVLAELHARYPDVYPQDNEGFYKGAVALRRFATPREIAWAIAFLASDAASFLTGAVIPVDGGFTAQWGRCSSPEGRAASAAPSSSGSRRPA